MAGTQCPPQLRAGTHFSASVYITSAHAGLTIQNYAGEHAVVSGGVPIKASKGDWKPYKTVASKGDWKPYKTYKTVATAPDTQAHVQMQRATPHAGAGAAGAASAGWVDEPNYNNVYGIAKPAIDHLDVKYIGKFHDFTACWTAANQTAKAKGAAPFYSVTWHKAGFEGRPSPYDDLCYARTSNVWLNRTEQRVHSAKASGCVPAPPRPHPHPSPGPGPHPHPPPPAPPSPPAPPNIWFLDLSTLAPSAAASLKSVLGLRVNKGRAIRAKYPNGNPELSGPDAVDVLTYKKGWVTQETTWTKPKDKWSETKDDVTNGDSWPGVNWPKQEERHAAAVGGGSPGGSGEGDHGDYHIGHGGFCDDLDPPTGYWCSKHPPRGQCYDPGARTSKGCTQTHMSPDGLTYNDGLLPNAHKYANPKGAVVQAWRCIRWFTNLCLVESQDKGAQTLTFDPKVGCNQGGEVRRTAFAPLSVAAVFTRLCPPFCGSRVNPPLPPFSVWWDTVVSVPRCVPPCIAKCWK